MKNGSISDDALLAADRLGGYVRKTPLEYSPYFSELTGANVWLKLENLQITGSFKLRGAFNKLLSLSPEQTASGCVAASSGNHGAAVAYAMDKLGVGGVVLGLLHVDLRREFLRARDRGFADINGRDDRGRSGAD